MTSPKYKRSLWLLLGLLTLLTTLSMAQKGVTYFKKTITVPFALRDGSKVIKAGEYTLKIQDEGGMPMLHYMSKDGDTLFKKIGDRDSVPEKDRTFDRGGHFKISAAPDPKNADVRLIVFIYDFVDPKGGQYIRYRFSVPEAAAAAKD